MSGNLSKSAFLEGGWVNLSADFRGKGASPTNHCWCQSSKVTALSCGIKISAVHHLDLSQSTRVTDRWTDRIMTPKTALAYAHVVKILTMVIREQDRHAECCLNRNFYDISVNCEFKMICMQKMNVITHH